MFTLNLVQIRKLVVLISLLILTGGVGYRLGQKGSLKSLSNSMPGINVGVNRTVPVNKQNLDLNLFWGVWDRLEQSYLQKSEMDSQKMIYGAISGMVASLGDPYTVFLPPTEQKMSKEDLAGSFDGVGIQLGFKDTKMTVIAPLLDTPAFKAGVKAGDSILRIKDVKKNIDKDTIAMTLPEAVSLIKGPSGTEVTLTMAREGIEKPFDVTMKRDTIVVKSVTVTFDDSKIAHLTLSRFGERTNDEWDTAVKQIEDQSKNTGVKGIVLDLRNNPGGLLQGSIYIASEFLDGGPIVKQEQSTGEPTITFSVNRKGRLLKTPLVVLVNEGSASASEILAGVLQERKRAKVVGQKTFGKGTIQEAEELESGSGLHITIARWVLPSGKWIDKEGIKPDYDVKMDVKDLSADEAGQTRDSQLEKAIELLK